MTWPRSISGLKGLIAIQCPIDWRIVNTPRIQQPFWYAVGLPRSREENTIRWMRSSHCVHDHQSGECEDGSIILLGDVFRFRSKGRKRHTFMICCEHRLFLLAFWQKMSEVESRTSKNAMRQKWMLHSKLRNNYLPCMLVFWRILSKSQVRRCCINGAVTPDRSTEG
jgi:hypothetical protein